MLDQLTRHQIWVERYGNNIVKNEIIPILVSMREEIAFKLINATSFQIARQSQLLKEIDQIISGAVDKIRPSLFESMQELGEYETTWSTKLLDDNTIASVTIGAGLEPAIITGILQNNKMFLSPDSKGHTIDQLITKFGKAISKDVKSLITTGLTAGDTTDVIARNMVALSKTRTIDQARAVVLTVANHVGNEARADTWAEYDDLFEGMEYVATLDSRTTILCASRDGNVYPFNKKPHLPAHYRCRSVYVPKIKEEYALIKDGTRASANGQVKASMNYSDWLKTQSKTIQNEVLGVKRAELFRSGELTLDKFVSKNGDVYTLDELKQRDLLK